MGPFDPEESWLPKKASWKVWEKDKRKMVMGQGGQFKAAQTGTSQCGKSHSLCIVVVVVLGWGEVTVTTRVAFGQSFCSAYFEFTEFQ